MKKIACHYAIVRFTPFVETGEFANVGILMISPKERYFGYKLLTRKHGRITRFFEELDPKTFKGTMYDLKAELARVNEVLKGHGFDKRLRSNDIDFAHGLFKEVIRPRENIIRFSEQRVVLAENPRERLNELFAYYVERNFVTKEYRETILEKGMRKLLYTANVGERFTREKVGDGEYEVAFPFVQRDNNKPLKIIKPLNLSQDTTSKIIEHGGNWWFRIRELKKRHALPEKVLFAVDGPSESDPRCSAYEEVVGMLSETGITVSSYKNKDSIIEFAQG
jgi:hypothetical protein